MNAERAIQAIQLAAERRAEAAALRQGATEDLRVACLEAQKEGESITRIASAAGLSRQGVYDLLEERP